MKRLAILALGTIMLGLPVSTPMVHAQTATTAALTEVLFDVPDMTCGLCPLTVETAMSGVEGVQSVEVDLDTLSARVIFDAALTTAAAIAEASAQAGYPATVKG